MTTNTQEGIRQYNSAQLLEDQKICNLLMKIINSNLEGSTSKLWHGAPVWFLDGNPTVGYSKLKSGIKLLFWSGADFGEEKLKPGTGKFKDASITYTKPEEINEKEIIVWINKSKEIQWDYKNIVKRKGVLIKI